MAHARLSQRLWKAAPSFLKNQTRQLSLHEYQSYNLLRDGRIVTTAEEARLAAQELGPACMLKAQVLGGGRSAGKFDNGLASGVQAVSSPDEAAAMAGKMLNQRLTTPFTPGGHVVDRLWVSQASTYDAQWYLAMNIDRENFRPAIVISKRGGDEIDVVARDRPETLFTFNFGLSEGITDPLMAEIRDKLELVLDTEVENLRNILVQMHKLFKEREAVQLEINPLGRTRLGNLTALNANFTFDNPAEKRQQEVFAMRDKTQEVPAELEAEKSGLLYVRMDGDIGNVVNGAGLAMATNDAVAHYGGKNANFLDAGGKATTETMIQAFKIITSDPRVKAILVNIYGGITRCDMIAESIIGAKQQMDINVPMVVRLQGTNSQAGLKMLEEADLGLIVVSDFGEAAKKAVEAARK